jgi:hypothetical protein
MQQDAGIQYNIKNIRLISRTNRSLVRAALSNFVRTNKCLINAMKVISDYLSRNKSVCAKLM